ncbi:MAG: phosphoglycerate mutase family protein, partial [Patescibacteria group bacterium]|nr:phosphoglycerate mutase family protein [Patescibacteria group bacterium]
MNNTFYFLRHGETRKDRNLPISQWTLSDKGKEQAEKLAREKIFNDIDIIFSSTEEKAFQTAKPIADSLGKEITQLQEISELNRDQGGFIEDEEYAKVIKYCLENLNGSIHNWETATHALERFSRKTEELDKEYENQKILVVGHGFTINLYFAKLLGVLNKVYERFYKN